MKLENKVYAFSFFWMFLVIMPVIIPFFLSRGLSMEQIFQLQAIFGISVAILEVPSGYLSDLWGRKKTLLVGTFLSGCGFTYLYFADTFPKLVLFEFLNAAALSLVSGTDLAILYDSLQEDKNNDRSRFQNAVANIQLAKVTGESTASLIGGGLALISLKAVAIGHAVAGWIPFTIALTLKEPQYEKMDQKDHLANMRKVLSHVFRSGRMLWLTFVNLVIWGLATFIAVWMFQKHWQEAGVAFGLFGILWAVYNLTVGIVGKFTYRVEKKFGATFVLIAIGLLPVAGYFGMGAFAGWLGILCGLLFKVSRGFTQVILKDALNWRTRSEMRATVNSLTSLFFRMGFAVVGPGVGWLIDKYSIYNAFNVLGVAFAFLFLVFMVPLILEIRKENLDEIPHST